MTKAKNYTGFGETHGLREWARLLDVNKDTLRYNLTTKGLSIEAFAEQNGITYRPSIDEGRTRVNRVAQAEALLSQLFDRSGYNPQNVTTSMVPGQRCQKVYYVSEYVGVYNIDTGALRFADNVEGINLIEYPIPDPMVHRYPEGWGTHPSTRAGLVQRIAKPYNPELMPK